MFSNLWKSVKSAGSSVLAGAKNAADVAKGLANPLKYLKANKGIILGSLKKLPLIGSIIETAIGAFNISDIKNDPTLTAEQKKEAIGREIASRFGSLAGGVLGGAVLSPIPVVGTILGGIAGAMGGEWIGGAIADMMGSKGIYDFSSSLPIIGDLIHVDDVAKESDLNMEQIMERTKGMPPMDATNPINGSITPSASSPVGSLNNQAASERNSLADMRSGDGQNRVSGNQTSNNQVNNVSNSTTNIHVSEGTRNTEPTVKQMQREMY